MGGGKSGGGSKPVDPQLFEIAQQLLGASTQVLDTSLGNLQLGSEALGNLIQTGGSGALLPSIQQAIEAGRNATSQAQTTTVEDLTRRGITGTAAAQILAQQQLAGDLAVSQIGPNFALPLISSAITQSLGQVSPGLSGIGGAASLFGSGINPNANSRGGAGPTPSTTRPVPSFLVNNIQEDNA